MKFRKFGKALLMSALSIGLVLSVTSCVQSYTVGFLYVTGNQTSGSAGQGVISGFKIDHNTGKLTPIDGLPIASGGANPGRAVLTQSSRYLYVLNRGADAAGDANCSGTTGSTVCNGANITQFIVGANGILTAQATVTLTSVYGSNPIRLVADSAGGYLYVLFHDAPSSTACAQVLGTGVTSCGEISAFKIDPSTGRLSLLLNAQVTSSLGGSLPYFPVPANPIDFVLSTSYMLTLTGNPANGDSVFPYAMTSTTGQLTLTQTGIQPLNVRNATAIQFTGSKLFVLSNDPLTATDINGNTISSQSQIVPLTVGTGGALQASPTGNVPDAATLANPAFILVESKGKWAYVANQGTSTNTVNTLSGIAGWNIDTGTGTFTVMRGSPFTSGAVPQCLIEDPSSQFVYTANFADSTVTGLVIDQNAGTLSNLPGAANKAYALPGPAAYCLVNGRTS